MATSRELLVENEDEALRLVHEALEGRLENRDIALKFERWPIIEIRLCGKGYDSSITADTAEALIEIQNALNRSYAQFVHGSGNARTLTAQERQRIKFKAKVKKGSSVVEINLGDFALKLAQELVGKMTSTELVITVLGLGLIGGSTLAYRWFLQQRSEDKKVDAQTQERVALSTQETKRLEIVAQALAAQPRLEDSRQDFDEARTAVLKSVGDASTVAVNGVELPRDSARQIARTSRARSEDVQLNGNYVIQKIDWHDENDVRLTLESRDEYGTFVASLGEVREQHREMLKTAEWARKPVYMSINATKLRGEVTTARIVAVAWPISKAG